MDKLLYGHGAGTDSGVQHNVKCLIKGGYSSYQAISIATQMYKIAREYWFNIRYNKL